MVPGKKGKQAVLSIWVILVLTIVSCNSRTVYDQFKTVHRSGWDKDSVAYFSVFIPDTMSRYDVMVTVRNNAAYPYQNFWMFIDEQSPTGKVEKDTVECYLADDRGRWLGRGFSVYSMPVLIAHHKKFHHRGYYFFGIRQGMRDDLLKGITAIGLEIRK
ncbi:MAG: gliding motility lipoprotein GldH [Microbacter sp.]